MPIPLSFTNVTTLSADGNSAAISLGNATEAEVTIYMGSAATWGSGTAILQQSFDGGTTYFTVPNASWTSGTASTQLARLTLIGGGQFRVNLSGSTSPSLSFNIKVEQVNSQPVRQVSFTADGNSSTFQFNPKSSFPVTTKSVDDDILVWAAQGTWGSGTMTLMVSPDGGTTWYKQAAGLTANGIKYANGVSDNLFRFNLAGATNPALTVYFVA